MSEGEIAAVLERYKDAGPDEKRQMERVGFAALEGNPAWFAVLRPWIEKQAERAAEAHEDLGKSPTERSEWIHAMKLLRELKEMPEKKGEKKRRT